LSTGMLSESLRMSLAEAATTYHQSVDLASEYLARRGITQAAAAAHLLGYVTEANVAVGHEAFVNRVSIPYITTTGVIDLRFRSISDEVSPKYLGRVGAELTLYNPLSFSVPSDVIAICEGEIDTITAHTLVGIPAIGIAGVNAWKPYYARAFGDYQRVLVLADGDQPGRELGKKIATQVDQAVVIVMPDGMDVNGTYLQEGAEGIRRRAGV